MPCQPELAADGQNEWSASFERQIIPEFAVRVTGVYSKRPQHLAGAENLRPFGAYSIPITQPIPGPNGVVVAGNPLGTITFYEYSPALAPSSFQQPMLINDPGANQTYRSFEWRRASGSVTAWM